MIVAIEPLNRFETPDTKSHRHVRITRNPTLVVQMRRQNIHLSIVDSVMMDEIEDDQSLEDQLKDEVTHLQRFYIF